MKKVQDEDKKTYNFFFESNIYIYIKSMKLVEKEQSHSEGPPAHHKTSQARNGTPSRRPDTYWTEVSLKFLKERSTNKHKQQKYHIYLISLSQQLRIHNNHSFLFKHI